MVLLYVPLLARHSVAESQTTGQPDQAPAHAQQAPPSFAAAANFQDPDARSEAHEFTLKPILTKVSNKSIY